MTIDEMIAVLEAAKAGKVIEYRRNVDGVWNITTTPVWNFDDYIYRVKPEPRRIWLNEYPETDIYYRQAYTSIEFAMKNAGEKCLGQVEFVEVLK